ncbi:tyrosine-type recombinase/integrase [Roseateles puraquae]|uniref:Integrase n=1 Tax=Roseateles puraquae TaxID=431059 RepID=A0A254N5G0_9BURK|nr:tyrosine-type recombinase/integrase [Roseateles puraquae]MDG0854447.1 integrase [Roseateles puraquae]OWR00845.1 integrase [Roseateles puraquae]
MPSEPDSAWVDLGVVPPQRLPAGAAAVADYLALALGHPVFERWNWTRMIRVYGALPDARRAKPALCRLLIDAPEAVEAWQRGRLQLFSASEAPAIEAVVSGLLKTHRKRFQAEVSTLDDGRRAGELSGISVVARGLSASLVNMLDGQGRFANADRATNTLGALSDLAAVEAFLREKTCRSRHTWRAYVAELERLATWCRSVDRGPLSDLTRQDLQAYRQWLSQPRADLLEGGAAEAPLAARSLGERSQARALAVLGSLFRHWHETGYLIANPAAGMASGRRQGRSLSAKRCAPAELLALCDRWVEQHTPGEPNAEDLPAWRRAAIWALFRCSGVRLAELAWRAEHGLPRLDVDAQGHWTLHVLGKGNKARAIPLPGGRVGVLRRYRVARGLPDGPGPLETLPLFHGEKGGALGPRGLYDEVKAVLAAVAAELGSQDPAQAALLREVSPHWLRHAYARTLVVDHQVPLPAAQQLLGHASVQTTAEYAKTDLRQLRDLVEQAWDGATAPRG